MNDTQPEIAPAPTPITQRLDAIELRLDRGAAKMDEQGAALARMADDLARNSETTTEVRELLAVGKSGLKVLGWLGAAGKWVGVLATAGLAVYSCFYAITHGGQMPPKP